jgi:D-alanine-D-alanine ligase
VITREAWRSDPDKFIQLVTSKYGYPVIVKPVCLGSSIGVQRCPDLHHLKDAIDTALLLDDRALVERALVNFIEVNCSVLGPPTRSSICEQPCTKETVLTFDQKYKRGSKGGKAGKGTPVAGGMASLERIVPAPIPEELTAAIQQLAVRVFDATGARGVARVDFLLENSRDLYVNEINTMPGSLAYYLWEPVGLPFDELVTALVDIALRRYAVRKDTQFSFATNLLQHD